MSSANTVSCAYDPADEDEAGAGRWRPAIALVAAVDGRGIGDRDGLEVEIDVVEGVVGGHRLVGGLQAGCVAALLCELDAAAPLKETLMSPPIPCRLLTSDREKPSSTGVKAFHMASGRWPGPRTGHPPVTLGHPHFPRCLVPTPRSA